MAEKIKDKAKQLGAKVIRKLNEIRAYKDILENKVDYKQRLTPFFEPSDIRTASRFNANQVDFQTDVRTATKYYPEMVPLKILAEEQGFIMISHKGLGRDEAIKYEQATKPSGLPSQLGIFQGFTGKNGEKKKEKEGKK